MIVIIIFICDYEGTENYKESSWPQWENLLLSFHPISPVMLRFVLIIKENWFQNSWIRCCIKEFPCSIMRSNTANVCTRFRMKMNISEIVQSIWGKILGLLHSCSSKVWPGFEKFSPISWCISCQQASLGAVKTIFWLRLPHWGSISSTFPCRPVSQSLPFHSTVDDIFDDPLDIICGI